MKTDVVLKYCPDLEGSPIAYQAQDINRLTAILHDIFSTLPSFSARIAQSSVLIKPNLVRPHMPQLPAMTTDPRLILALVQLCHDYGAQRVSIGEKPGYGFPARKAFQNTGLVELAQKYGYKLICFDEEPWFRGENPKADLFLNPLLPKASFECDILLNVPKLKTHIHTLVSLGLKNFQGLVADDERMLYHRCDINHKIVDTILARQPDFTLIDGLWAMEGQAPFFGDPVKDFNVLIAGENVVAVDTTACSIMGIDTAEVTHLRLAHEKGLGPITASEINLKGEDLNTLRRTFRRPVLSSVGVYQAVQVIEGGACSGCLSAIRHSLDKLDYERKMAKLKTLTLCVGRTMPNHSYLEKVQSDLWLFGNCAAEIIFPQLASRTKSFFVQGCPPHVLDLYQEFLNNYNL